MHESPEALDYHILSQVSESENSENTVAWLSLLRAFLNRVQICDHLSRKLQSCSLQILAKMSERGCARDQQNVGRAIEEPGKRHLHRRCADGLGDLGQR